MTVYRLGTPIVGVSTGTYSGALLVMLLYVEISPRFYISERYALVENTRRYLCSSGEGNGRLENARFVISNVGYQEEDRGSAYDVDQPSNTCSFATR